MGERQGTPWTGRQSITGQHTNNHAHTHTPKDNLESPINLTGMSLDCGRKPEYPRLIKVSSNDGRWFDHKTVVQYVEKLDLQRRLLEIRCKHQIKLQRIALCLEGRGYSYWPAVQQPEEELHFGPRRTRISAHDGKPWQRKTCMDKRRKGNIRTSVEKRKSGRTRASLHESGPGGTRITNKR
ncbi:hypothetical protein CHARACLAT_020163 [Characodon lateralis]|uniref:Uncharacterized protein n=1 Tax=Characodon lateralis TaxID=208331 RepID=A0ABU7ECK0_9TELE|nr:hypothetical protein [Characodon lateralis]